ncbi:hypothetical protein [Prevotella multiformis]|uniref:Uncharacterized protein n=1 Tax=Prevotella multiformis DSM 16608 TaxID=888743 RepID=F0FB47_9BACT|nr:hypothetical protein [Prevotella multiformis]EGC18615.1 hypothetical protein HMPREF9141_2814 [Prevotella multiformis DSM 16608]
MIEIYGSDNHLKCRIEPADNSQQDKTLGGDNLLSLSFTHHSFVQLDVNDWCEFEGERYWLQERYLPTQKSEREWDYDLKFYGVESLIKRLLVLKNPDGENEAVFTLTAPASEHVRLIVGCINAGMGTSDWKTGSVVATENLTVDYSGTFCDEGLRKVAEAAKTEWWVEGQTVNVCRCEHGEELTLRYPESITQLERDTADGVKFYTRLFPMGSTRNIDRAKYGSMRLQLPGGQKYVDMNVEKYGIFHHYEEAAFSHIYPRRIGTVSSVRESSVKDNEGKPFKIYWFKDSALPFNPNDYEIGGLVKHVVFQSGELDGRDFEVNYHADTQEFEIITTWPYDDEMQMPGGNLIPKAGDKYILWNIRMPDEYYGLAEQEFLAAVEAFNAKHCIDTSVYKCPTHHVWIERNRVQLYIGRRIRLESQQYFPEAGFRSSRITRISRSVTLPSQMNLEISDATSTGSMTRINDGINEAKSYAMSALGAVPDIIRSGESTLPTDTNLFSARRSQKEFLSKKEEDVAQQLITFLKGIGLGADGRFSVNADGVALLSRILVGNYVKGSSGAGIYADGQGNYHIEGDYVHVRKQLTAEEVQLMKSTHINGRIINSPGSFTISRVEKTDGGWRCYFTQQDGEGRMISNTMGMDDYAYCETFNLVNQQGRLSNHYWHRRVFGLGADYVDICDNTDADDYASGSDEPQAGDEVSTLGNRTDPARRHAIVQAAAGTGSPYYRMYVGIRSFSLPKPKIQMSPTEGSWWMVTDEHGNDMPMEEYIASLKSQVSAVQEQADRQLVIWFGDAVPSATAEPAGEWTDEATKEMHLHDIYYNRSYAETGGGRAYSFEKNPDGSYSWHEITDADVLKSLEAAQRAQDTADGKRRVFVREQPVPPYDKGDQWSNATYEGRYQNDLLVCVRTKAKDESFDIDDWSPSQALTSAQFKSEIKTAADKISATVTNLKNGLVEVGFELDGEKKSFTVTAENFKVQTPEGKVALMTSDGKVNADLIEARSVRTLPGANGLHIDMREGTFDILTADNRKGISMTVDENGFPHLVFFDREGRAKYDLGYTGLKELVSAYRAAYWTRRRLVDVTGRGLAAVWPKTARGREWHEYHAAFHYVTGKLGEHAEEDGRLFELEDFAAPIPDGWYTDENLEGQFLAGGGETVDDGDPNGVPGPRVYGVKIGRTEGGRFTRKGLTVWFRVVNGRASFCDTEGKPLAVGLLQDYPFQPDI